ncbi:MAG: trypsin-like peptidase domain-containing protein [Actinobacteria bacterium]|nr:trypsin-like peptidase domain-containing protein [Actinomycetota bacterium]
MSATTVDQEAPRASVSEPGGTGEPPAWPPADDAATPPSPPRRRRGAGVLIAALVAVAALVGAGSGAILARGHTSSAPTATAASSGGAASVMSVEAAVVDVNTTLGYQGAQAAGTGIVLTSNGEVLTNNHVVEGATTISVTDVGNGRTYGATVVGYDVAHDIAVLQLTGASGLTTAGIGKSSTLAVGDAVAAVGNAGGVGGAPSTTTGAVTALNQSIVASDAGAGTSEQLTGLIQINAQLASGDSGGPLVNSSGQVVGIDTAGSGGFSFRDASTEGFAVPIDTAMSVAHRILSGESSSTVHVGATAFLGVQIASQSGFSAVGSGAPVAGVIAGSPAQDAGIAPGDVITSVAGHAVSSPDDLSSILQQDHPGDKVAVGWLDGSGAQHTATVQLVGGPTG